MSFPKNVHTWPLNMPPPAGAKEQFRCNDHHRSGSITHFCILHRQHVVKNRLLGAIDKKCATLSRELTLLSWWIYANAPSRLPLTAPQEITCFAGPVFKAFRGKQLIRTIFANTSAALHQRAVSMGVIHLTVKRVVVRTHVVYNGVPAYTWPSNHEI